MFELVLFSIKIISKTCTVVFNGSVQCFKSSRKKISEGIKEYQVDSFERDLFSNTINCKFMK